MVSQHALAMLVVVAIVGGGASTLGCLTLQPFQCETPTQCDDEQGGVCADGGFCAYPDPDCGPGGLRYDEHAGDGLAEECVGAGTGATSADPTSVSNPTDVTNPTSLDPDTTQTSTIDSGGDTTEDTGPLCGGPGEDCCDGDECEDGLACTAGECGSCIVAIEAGDRHNCAIRLDGQLLCWGANDVGQLGDSAQPFEPLPVPAVATEPDDPIVAVSAVRHTCVRSEGGNVRCWGDNAANQVDPALAQAIAPPTPASWAPASAHVSTGVSHTCAANGVTTSCWGSNTQSQLSSAVAGPGPVTFANPGYIDLVLGGDHSCAIAVDSTLSCWGANAQGQLAQDPATVPVVVDATVIPGLVVDAIALGRQHTCALAGGVVSCWGRNDLGQLGDGSGVMQFMPVVVALPMEAGSITAITAGPHHTCAIDDATALWCWGSNDLGQLMLEPDMNGNDIYTLVPVAIEVGEGVLAVTAGQTHTCALTDQARILCWGTNTSGQIGDGGIEFAHVPTSVMFDCG